MATEGAQHMFRMVPGIDLAKSADRPRSVPLATIAGLAAVLAVTFMAPRLTDPQVPVPAPSALALAQRSAAIVADTYRADVGIDHRDRMFLLTYASDPMMSADRFAWAVCDTIRSVPSAAGPASTLRDWQVVALPAGGMPGSCRIGAGR